MSGEIWGNLLLGGAVGVIVDAASGAGSRPPGEIMIWMEPSVFESGQDRQKWLCAKDEAESARRHKRQGDQKQAFGAQ